MLYFIFKSQKPVCFLKTDRKVVNPFGRELGRIWEEQNERKWDQDILCEGKSLFLIKAKSKRIENRIIKSREI